MKTKIKIFITFFILRSFNILAILLVLQMFTACRSYKEAWLNPYNKEKAKHETVSKLPNLIPIIDSVSVEKAILFNRWNKRNAHWNYYHHDSIPPLRDYEADIVLYVPDWSKDSLKSADHKRYCGVSDWQRERSAPIQSLNLNELSLHPETPDYGYIQETGNELIKAISKNPKFFDWWNKGESLIKEFNSEPDGRFRIGFIQYYDHNAIDAFTLINNYINNNIIDTIGDPKGTIEISIETNYHKCNVALYVISSLTVYTINFLGFPITSQKKSITLTAKIKNNQGEIIKEYSETAKGRATSAMYWGFTYIGGMVKTAPFGLARAVNTFTITHALQSLNEKINLNSKEIINALEVK